MKRAHLFLLAFAASAAPALVQAQTQTSTDEVSPLVVVPSRLPTTAQASPYSVNVLGARQLEGARDLGDALSGVADVQIQAPGGRSGFGSLYLRGGDENFTSVMFDGVPLNAPTNNRGGAYNVSELSTQGLSRVEVAAGPLSGLYGSGSLAGGVNLVPVAGSDHNQFSVALTGGSRSDYGAFGLWRGPVGGSLGASLAVESTDDGHTDEEPGARFRGQSLTGKIASLDDPDAGHLTFRLSQTRARSFPDKSGGPLFAASPDLDNRRGTEQLIGADKTLWQSGSTQVTVFGSYVDRRDQLTSPGVSPPFAVPASFDHVHYSRAQEGANIRSEFAGWQGVLGAEAQQEKGRDVGELVFVSPSNFNMKRDTQSVFAEIGHDSAGWSADGGLRLDKIEGFGPRVTSRAGVRYTIGASGWSLRANGGTGFKAPSFYALGNPLVGNADLRPEQSISGEAGIEWRAPNDTVRVSLVAFDNRYKNLIDFVFLGPIPKLVNRNRVTAEGAAFTVDAVVTPSLTASLQADYIDTRDDNTDERLEKRPRTRITSAWRWTASSSLDLTARFNFVGDRLDDSVPTGTVTLKSYSTVDLAADWRLPGRVGLRLTADNILDKTYQDAVGFPSPGRSGRLTLSKDF